MNKERANQTAGNTIVLGIILSVIFLVFGLTCAEAYISSQTSTSIVLTMGIEYLSICCIFSFGSIFFGIYEKLIQATGRSIYSTIGQITGALVNIILDPILIYGWFGFSAMGVTGAAYATVIGQIASGLLCLFFYYKYCPEIKKNISYIRPSRSIIKEIYAVGLPAIIAQGLTSVMTYALNIVLGSVNETLVTAYGLYYKVQYFVLMMSYGLKDGTTPIISYALGMGNKKRVKVGVKYGIFYTTILMIFGFIILEILTIPLANLFELVNEAREHYISVSRIATIGLIFAGANIAIQSAFQAVGNGVYSVTVSFGRQFIFIVPIAYGFTLIANANPNHSWLIWTTFIIGEVITLLIAIILLKKTIENIEAIL